MINDQSGGKVCYQYPPPCLDMLTPRQADVIAGIANYLKSINYRGFGEESQRSEIVNTLELVCETESDQKKMIDWLESMVRWERELSYRIAFYFQLAMRQKSSTSFVDAARLYSRTQINREDDLALDSMEKAAVAVSGLGNVAELTNLVQQLYMVYRYYWRWYKSWYKSCDYGKADPLTDNLYTDLTFRDLEIAFPQQTKLGVTLKDGLVDIIRRCADPCQLYYRTLATRCLGLQFMIENNWTEAFNQFYAALQQQIESPACDNKYQSEIIEPELGHLTRLAAYTMYRSNDLQGAEKMFRKAVEWEHAGGPSCFYWLSISSRELGDMRLSLYTQTGKQEWLALALEAYRLGRESFERHIWSQVVPIHIAVKQQMSRSYSDNATQAFVISLKLLNSTDPSNTSRIFYERNALAEIDSMGPRYVTKVVQESQSANERFKAEDITQFKEARSIYYQSLTTFDIHREFDDEFNTYRDSVIKNMELRQYYTRKRQELLDPNYELGTEIVNRLCQLKPIDVTLLLFFVGWSETTVACVDLRTKEKQFEMFPLIGEKVLGPFRNAYDERIQNSVNASNRRDALDDLLHVYNTLFATVFQRIDFRSHVSGRSLVVFPRLMLNEIPFSALALGNQYLVDKCPVSILPNLGTFEQIHRVRANRSNRKLTIVWDDREEDGAPLYGGTINLLQQIENSEIIVLKNPSWEEFLANVQESLPGSVLFACHGEYNADEPASSNLQFSASNQISFTKVFSELQLSTCESVTLGACQSGLGRRILTAEELGLPTAFLSTGASNVICSLWRVNQLSAAVLMSFYYQSLLTSDVSIPQALRQAQIAVRDLPREQLKVWLEKYLPQKIDLMEAIEGELPFRHPYFWAGFYVFGDA